MVTTAWKPLRSGRLEACIEHSESNPGLSLENHEDAVAAVWKTVPECGKNHERAPLTVCSMRYCLPDSSFLRVCNPETLSRVTLALLGIGFQPNPLGWFFVSCSF